MPPRVAALVVFCTSAAVLVLEILAARLVAPYTGVTLETYSSLIGVALAGIAGGTWLGGRAADRRDPDRLIGPLVAVGGLLTAACVPLARLVGGSGAGEGPGETLLLAVVTLLAPAAVLSAVSPAVVKGQLQDLSRTGEVVGRLSAIGTAGAILGTFAAGFVLVELAPVSTTLVTMGGGLFVAGMVLWLWRSRLARADAALLAVCVLGTGVLTASSDDPCDRDTSYHCARVEADPARPGGRTLWLDTLRHSYVDLDDPTHLEFRYLKVVHDVLTVAAPADDVEVLHVGGGGFTMPRALLTERPSSRHLVLEIDDRLVDLAREELGLVTSDRLQVDEGDARLLNRHLPDGRFDVVIGDAFGGLAVPWHLTTVEYVRDLRRVMAPGGVYVLNVIDEQPLRFARAEIRTVAAVFDEVAVVVPDRAVDGTGGGNIVVVGSDVPIDGAAVDRLIDARDGIERTLVGAEALAFAGPGPILTDDHAPVDQWLTTDA